MSGLSMRPITLYQACSFVEEHHSQHDKPQGGLRAIALLRGDDLVGVAIAGAPSQVSSRDVATSTRQSRGRSNYSLGDANRFVC
jgi:hypothetical protein